MNANNETLSGITPAESNRILYIENTTKVETFLQKKFDLVIEQMNRVTQEWNDTHPDSEQRPLQEAVEITLSTTRMSSKFYPFLLIMPSSVLKERAGKQQKNELSIFNPQHSERAANMKKPLYEIIKPFMYDENDKEAFFTPTLQHELKISSRISGSIKANCRLKIHSFDKGRANYVAVLLDPIRLLHNMATFVNNSAPFIIQVDQVEQVKGGNFRYHFYQVFTTNRGKKKKGNDIIYQQIARSVTGRR